MLLRYIILTVVSCMFCWTVIADDECAIGYTPSEFVTTTNLFNPGEITKWHSYKGISYYGKIDSDYITLSINIREGKTIPKVNFGIAYISPGGAISANWLIASGDLKSTKATVEIAHIESQYKDWAVVFYGTENLLVTALDALEIQLEKGKKATPYIPYGYSYTVVSDCIPCSPNTYKDSVGNKACTPCPDALISPSGSKSASECGRVLHIGDKIYYMKSVKQTSPSLHIRDENGNIWYGNLYSEQE